MKEDIKDIYLITKVGMTGVGKIRFLSKRISNENIVKWLSFILKIIVFAPISLIYSIMLAFGLSSLAGQEYVYLTLYAGVIVSSVFCLFLSIYQASSYLFVFKDYESLSAMPIKTSSILTSRVIMLYLSDFFLMAIIFIPNFIAYGIVAKPEFSLYLYCLIILVFIPIIPIIISSFIAIIVSFLNTRFKIMRIIGLVVTLVFVGISMSIGFLSSSSDFQNINLDKIASLVKLYFPAEMFLAPVLSGNIIQFAIVILINICLIVLFIYIFQNIFKTVNSLLQQKQSKSNYKIKTVKSSSQIYALFTKEVRFYFSMNAYVINTSAGILLYILAVYMIITNLKVTDLINNEEIAFIAGYLPIGLSLAAVGVTSISPTTSVTFSLEAKTLDLLKTLPVKFMDMVLAKVLLNVLVNSPVILANSILMVVWAKASFFDVIGFIIFFSISIFVTALIGIILNLLFPKLIWKNPAEVVKRSASVMLTTLLNPLFIAIPILLIVFLTYLKMPFIFSSLIASVIMVIFGILMWLYIKTAGESKFKRI